jgi:hypothetical protein
MKLIKTFDVLISLLLVAVGGGLIYASRWDPEIRPLVIEQFSKPWIMALVGVFLIFVILLRILASAKKRCKKVTEEYIDFKSGDSSMKISKTAVKGYIQGVGDQFEELKSLRVELLSNKDLEDIHLKLQLKSGVRVRELTKSLRMRVRDCMCEELGLDEKLGDITIDIESVDGVPGKPKAAEKLISHPPPPAEPVVVVEPPVPSQAPRKEVPEEPVSPVEPEVAAPQKEVPEEPLPVESVSEETAPQKAAVEATNPSGAEEEPKERKLATASQYVFKPERGSDQTMIETPKGEGGSPDEVELDAEDNPFNT